jgi:hypothetical protein
MQLLELRQDGGEVKPQGQVDCGEHSYAVIVQEYGRV